MHTKKRLKKKQESVLKRLPKEILVSIFGFNTPAQLRQLQKLDKDSFRFVRKQLHIFIANYCHTCLEYLAQSQDVEQMMGLPAFQYIVDILSIFFSDVVSPMECVAGLLDAIVVSISGNPEKMNNAILALLLRLKTSLFSSEMVRWLSRLISMDVVFQENVMKSLAEYLSRRRIETLFLRMLSSKRLRRLCFYHILTYQYVDQKECDFSRIRYIMQRQADILGIQQNEWQEWDDSENDHTEEMINMMLACRLLGNFNSSCTGLASLSDLYAAIDGMLTSEVIQHFNDEEDECFCLRVFLCAVRCLFQNPRLGKGLRKKVMSAIDKISPEPCQWFQIYTYVDYVTRDDSSIQQLLDHFIQSHVDSESFISDADDEITALLCDDLEILRLVFHATLNPPPSQEMQEEFFSFVEEYMQEEFLSLKQKKNDQIKERFHQISSSDHDWYRFVRIWRDRYQRSRSEPQDLIDLDFFEWFLLHDDDALLRRCLEQMMGIQLDKGLLAYMLSQNKDPFVRRRDILWLVHEVQRYGKLKQ